MTFQHFPHTNAWGRKFDLAIKKVKGPLTVIIWTNLVDFESSMLYAKIQPKSCLGSGEGRFLSVSTVYGYDGHLVQLSRTI